MDADDVRRQQCSTASFSRQAKHTPPTVKIDLYLCMFPDGALKRGDMFQCKREKWVPVASFNRDGKVVIPAFMDALVCRRFAKRNFPADWLPGAISVSGDEVNWIHGQGWEIEVLRFPKRMPLEYQILQFQQEPNLYMV